MSRPRQYARAAEAKRQPMEVPDDTDESEWDDVPGHDLGADDEDVQEDQQ